MKYVKLGETDLFVSVIGLGSWALGGEGWAYSYGSQDDEVSIKTILKAFELGINWIDTAAVYGLGHSEKIVGSALKQWKDKIIIATKCGLLGDNKGKVYSSLKKQSIKKEAENSLKRLNIDCIDIYQIHWPKPLDEIEEAFSTLQELKKEGKIKYAGVSNFSVKQIERVKKIGTISTLQPPYSLLNRRIEDDIISYCDNNNIAIISYSPLQNGFLTDKTSRNYIDSLPDNDWRKTKCTYYLEPDLSCNLLFLESLKDFALKRNKTVSELAISWILSKNKIKSVIVGARTPLQIEKNLSAIAWELSNAELAEIDELCFIHKNILKNVNN